LKLEKSLKGKNKMKKPLHLQRLIRQDEMIESERSWYPH
jgi:hypothetical protein